MARRRKYLRYRDEWICEVCGTARRAGDPELGQWLIAEHQNVNDLYIVRCPEHITKWGLKAVGTALPKAADRERAKPTGRSPSLWVYKCRYEPESDNAAYGDWDEVFVMPWRRVRWGGAWATRRPDGKRIFDEEIEVGDLLLAWQSDRGAAIGLCEVTGRKPSPHGGTDLIIIPVEEFARPIKLHALKRTTHPGLADVAALKQGYAGTIYPTSASEARLLLKVCGSRFVGGSERGRSGGSMSR